MRQMDAESISASLRDGSEKMNRNEPCWCGSGKKYKHCHLAFDERINGMTFDVFKGQVRPPRKIINNEADIEGIRKAGVVNDRDRKSVV